MLQHQLELARAAGVEVVTIFAGHLAERIVDFVGDGERFGLDIRVRIEDAPLGNAGALVGALDALPEQFFVLYGDVMAAVDLQRLAEFHLRRGADFTALVHPNDHPLDSDLIEADAEGCVTAIQPYPHPAGACFANLASAALYAVRREAVRPFQGGSELDFTRDVARRPGGARRKCAGLSLGRVRQGHGLARPAATGRGRLARRPHPPGGRRRPPPGGVPRPRRHAQRRPPFHQLRRQSGAAPGRRPALRRLRDAGFLLIVVTNQPVIARGEATWAVMADIHRKLEWELGKAGAYVDAIYLCPHHPDAGYPGEVPALKVACDCRKPATGLVDQACRDFAIDRAASWMVGDSTRDVELARRAGLRSVLVRTGNSGADGRYPDVRPDHVVADIAAAAELVAQATLAPAA